MRAELPSGLGCSDVMVRDTTEPGLAVVLCPRKQCRVIILNMFDPSREDIHTRYATGGSREQAAEPERGNWT